jgi:hypothetical protein
LVVGADRRTSAVREQAGIPLHEAEPAHLVSGLLVEAIRLTSDRDAVTGEEVKRGFESITDFTAYGLLPGTMITADIHAGSRKVRRYQVRNGKLALERDWFEGPRPI